MAKPAVVVKYRYNPEPRLSANQIAEYLSATPLRRRAILREAKYPATVMVVRYEDAYEPVISHLVGSEDALQKGVLGLRMKSSADAITEFVRDNCDLCIDAILSFQSNLKKLDKGKVVFKRPPRSDTKLSISRVDISVSIDVLTEETSKSGQRSTGAAILVYSKTRKEDEMASRCKAVALLVYQMMKANPRFASTCVPELCMAIDVFNSKIYRSGAKPTRLWRTVETSCEDVQVLWPSIKPPADYNGPSLPKVA